MLSLKIVDDGKGFDVEFVLSQYEDGKHLGLKSMRERAQAVGGDMAITSAPGKGTVLEFQCPVPPRDQTLMLLSEDFLNSPN
jgi:signal transduction histidine kinase